MSVISGKINTEAEPNTASLGQVPGRIIEIRTAGPQPFSKMRPPSLLSLRELEIVELLSLGMTNKEIASGLFLSPETVKTYVARVFRKLGARNRTEAAFKAQVILETEQEREQPEYQTPAIPLQQSTLDGLTGKENR